MRKWVPAFLIGVAMALVGLVHPGFASGDLSIVTSYPSNFYEPVRLAFERRHPDIRLKISNRKTTSAVPVILDASREQADLFWASAPDAFEVLKQAGRLERLPETYPRPWMIGSIPADDRDGFYAGFAISGYGITWNSESLAVRGTPPPLSIRALGDPVYRGQVGMTTPSRSGTTHLMVESLLQTLGWDDGWAAWSEIAGNLATITARSYGVGSAVAQGRFAIGLSIDFLGRAGDSASPLRFEYPTENVFLPASIAILRGTKARADAETFVAFLMSAEGQAILRSPSIGRLPIDPVAYAQDAESPYRLAGTRYRTTFDTSLSSGRYELINLLFDEVVTYRLPALQTLWARVHAAEASAKGDAAKLAQLKEVRALIGAVPVNEADTHDPEFTADLKRVPWGVTPSLRQAALTTAWRAFLEANLVKATAMLDALAAGPPEERP